MKARKAKSYLVISSCYLGMSEDILKTYSNVAKEYGAQVIHLGPIASDREMTEMEKLTKKVESLESEIDRKEDTSRAATLDRLNDDKREAAAELKYLDAVVRGRVSVLSGHFPGITFVVPPDSMIKGSGMVKRELILSRYLYLSGIMPLTDHATVKPINDKAFTYLRKKGHRYSWIVPHPVPAIVPFPKPGLNQAHNYYTVGCLKHTEEPTNRKDMYQCSFEPCAILVLVDQENGEFHANQLFIDYNEGKGFKVAKPMVLIDGQRFTATGVYEVKAADKLMFSTDDHACYDNGKLTGYHPGVLGCVRACNELFRPETFVNGGDACDMPSVNRHIEMLRGKRENTRIVNDIDALQKLLTAQTNFSFIKSRILLDSNHHEWLEAFIDKNPELRGMADWETISKRYFANWHFIIRRPGGQEIFMFGDYTLRHGDKERDLSRAEKMFPKGKYVRGHTHRFAAHRRALSIGCGCLLAPDYTESEVNDWQNQFATATKFEGVTAFAPKAVFHDKVKAVSRFSYRNQIFETAHFVIK